MDVDAKKIYEEAIEQHGVNDPRALCIPDHKTHVDRLTLAGAMLNSTVHLSVIGPRITDYQIVDIGCGLGDLMAHTAMMYAGVDTNQKFIDEARQRWPNGAFYCCDADEFAIRHKMVRFRVAVALGVLATVPPENVEHFLRTMQMLTDDFVLISMIQPTRNYYGKFYQHAPENIVPVLGQLVKADTSHGELTCLIRVKP